MFRHGFGPSIGSVPCLRLAVACRTSKWVDGFMDRAVFDGLDGMTVVSWTSMILGYAQNGQPLEALRFFGLMRKLNVKPDWIVLVSVLKAYTDVENLGQGTFVHGCLIKMGLQFEPDLLIALTAMYAKSGQGRPRCSRCGIITSHHPSKDSTSTAALTLVAFTLNGGALFSRSVKVALSRSLPPWQPLLWWLSLLIAVHPLVVLLR
ncbi:hypothetical protein FF2_009492 [Malus domestica]